MKMACEEVQSQLAALEPDALRPGSELAAHIESCGECEAVWTSLQLVDLGLAAMPPVVVPDELIARTLLAAASDEAFPRVEDEPQESPGEALKKSPILWIRILDQLSKYPHAVAAAATVALLFVPATLGLGFYLTASFDGADSQMAEQSASDSTTVALDGDKVRNSPGWAEDAEHATNTFDTNLSLGGGGQRWAQNEPAAAPAPPEVVMETRPRDASISGRNERGSSRSEGAPAEIPIFEAARERSREARPDVEEPEERQALSRLSSSQDNRQDLHRELEPDRDEPADQSRRRGQNRPGRDGSERTTAFMDPYLDDDDEGGLGRVQGLGTIATQGRVAAGPTSGLAQAGEMAQPYGTTTFDDGRYRTGEDAGDFGYYAPDDANGDGFIPSGDYAVTIITEDGEVEEDLADIARIDLGVDELGYRGPARLRLPSAGDVSGNDLDWTTATIPPVTLGALSVTPSNTDRERARAFLAERERTSNLGFQAARGYWANTYIPGDPVLRELQRRLEYTEGQDPRSSSGLALARSVDTYSQPFDRPQHSALAVYLQADNRGVRDESRVLLQVGLQGTSRQSGRRPAMNIGVVLDLRDTLNPEVAESVHALLQELSEARDVGDHFSLTVAGAPGGTVIPPGTFGYGPVTVVASELLEGPQDHSTGLTVEQAMETAVRLVRENDDPAAALGSSLVLLITPGSFGAETMHLEALAHEAAVDGIPTSVVGIGGSIDLAELDSVALAGQGNRRLLANTSEAEAVVARELSAASRVVARAVRLRVRLAPGVRLVDVLGSYRLDEETAERVREAEQSIDRRVARSLGISADRGEDEDGIQIVIPAFYANDRHVILLDVVVPGPGPVADVTLRYKDLVFLRNGVAMDTLRLQRDDGETGPLEINVLKNLVAFELSETLKRAGELVRAGHVEAAVGEVSDFSGLLRGLQAELPQFTADPEIFADLEMIRTYVQVLNGASGGYATAPTDLADSLLYAGYRKLLETHQSNDD